MGIGDVLRDRRIRQLDISSALSVDRRSTVTETVQAMKAAGRGAALVTENGKLVGIFTERDLVRKVIGNDGAYHAPVDQFMTNAPATLSPDGSVFEALALMDERGYRNIPIVDDQGRVLGSLSVSKIVRFLAESYPQEVLSLPPRADQSFVAADGA